MTIARASRLLITLILLVLSSSGCGGPSTAPVGFVNQTQHSDAQLWALWRTAQQDLSQRIDLNPIQQEFTGTAPNVVPGDARVWSVSPRQLTVATQLDVSAAVLYAATGDQRSDPTGLIACPQPCNVRYAPAYSQYAQPTTQYAASWESTESNFDYLVEYEFENQILNALGYDMRWR